MKKEGKKEQNRTERSNSQRKKERTEQNGTEISNSQRKNEERRKKLQ